MQPNATEDAGLTPTDSVTTQITIVPKQQKRTLLIKHWLRYCIVGTSSAAIELGLFSLLYYYLGFYVVVSNMVALTIAMAYNFTLSRKWTFKATSRVTRSLVLYLLLFAWNQFFSSGSIVALMSLGIPALLAKVMTMLFIVSWNFILYRTVIFK